MKWYADNSELNGAKGAAISDTLLFGGVVVPDDAEHELRQAVERIKKTAAHPRAPIKWNMKDLKRLYEDQDQVEIYKSLLTSSKEWRLEIFKEIANYDVTMIVACIEAYSANRETIKKTRERLTGYAFCNGLMRYGLHVRERSPKYAQVVMDWPDKGNSQPYDREYSSAFRRGSAYDNAATYNCGALHKIGFTDSVLFANMRHSTMLQVADLVVGATREYVECCLEKRTPGTGVECLKIVRHKWRGAPDNVVGRGIIVPRGNIELNRKIRAGVKGMLNSE